MAALLNPAPASSSFATVLEAFMAHRSATPIVLAGGMHGAGRDLGRDFLLENAHRAAGALQARGLRPGDRILMLMPTGPELLSTIFATWLAGGVVVVTSPFKTLGRTTLFEEDLRHKIKLIAPKFVVAHPTVDLGPALPAELGAGLVSSATLTGGPAAPFRADALPRGTDLAVLQFTSGSTGFSKATKILHSQLVDNIRCMGEHGLYRPGDREMSWLPIYHDMGLVGGLLAPLYHDIPLYLMPTETFAADPSLWLKAMTDFEAVTSVAPPSICSLLARRIPGFKLKGVDLRALRSISVGSEPIAFDDMNVFTARFKSMGLRETVLHPCYGMAEATLALTARRPGTGYNAQWIDAETFRREGHANPATPGAASSIAIVGGGHILPEVEVRLADGAGQPVGDRREGRVLVRGPYVSPGYWGEADKNHRAEWFETGDLGFFVNGEIYITGRAKDVMKRAGVAYHPSAIEQAAQSVRGLRRGRVTAFSYQDHRKQKESFVVVFEVKRWRSLFAERIGEAVRRAVIDQAGVQVDEVCALTPGSIPKTSSGKLQRSLCKDLYVKGRLRRVSTWPRRLGRWINRRLGRTS